MLKKIILGLCFLAFNFMPAFADSAPISDKEIKEIEEFFNSYVDSANNYKEDLINYYIENANIERIVIKPNGKNETVKIPMKRYKKELIKGKIAAKFVNYKNRYENRKYEKLSDSIYKIKTKRYPMKDKKGLNAEFTITKTPNGLKISSEKMETTVQRFLEEK